MRLRGPARLTHGPCSLPRGGCAVPRLASQGRHREPGAGAVARSAGDPLNRRALPGQLLVAAHSRQPATAPTALVPLAGRAVLPVRLMQWDSLQRQRPPGHSLLRCARLAPPVEFGQAREQSRATSDEPLLPTVTCAAERCRPACARPDSPAHACASSHLPSTAAARPGPSPSCGAFPCSPAGAALASGQPRLGHSTSSRSSGDRHRHRS